jgi:hypothetical protein
LHRRFPTRAYELYEQRGRQDGRAVQDWEKAEREIRKGESPNEPARTAGGHCRKNKDGNRFHELVTGDDYPDFVVPLARAVARCEVTRGLAICGSISLNW